MRFTNLSETLLTSIKMFFTNKINTYTQTLDNIPKKSRTYQNIKDDIREMSELYDKYDKLLSSYEICSNEKIIYNGNVYYRYEELRRLTETQIEALKELDHSKFSDFPKYIVNEEKNYINLLEEFLSYLKENILFAV